MWTSGLLEKELWALHELEELARELGKEEKEGKEGNEENAGGGGGGQHTRSEKGATRAHELEGMRGVLNLYLRSAAQGNPWALTRMGSLLEVPHTALSY